MENVKLINTISIAQVIFNDGSIHILTARQLQYCIEANLVKDYRYIGEM